MRLKRSKSRAQLSLEYLLVMAAAISLLSLFFSIAVDFQHKSAFALEKQKARQFHQEIEDTIEELTLFGNGSSQNLAIANQQRWIISIDSGNLRIGILKEDDQEEVLDFALSEAIQDIEFICNNCSFNLTKEKSGFYINNIINKKQ